MSPEVEAALAAADPVMAGLVRAAGPCRIPPQRRQQPYEALLSAIAHQQLTGKAAATILGRFRALYGPEARFAGTGGYPTPEALLATPDEALRGVGFSRAKSAALKDIAAKALEGVVPPRRDLARLGDEAIIERLTQVRGVGRWTVEMFLMFTLARPDILPVADYGVQNGFRLAYGKRLMPKPKALAAYGERWAPYRTTAAWYLWRAVDLGRTGQLPPPPGRKRA